MPEPDIRVSTPGESGRSHIIISPFQFYVNGEDHLRITSANALAGVVIEVTGRFFDQDAQQITPIVERQTPNTDRSVKQTLIHLGKGYLLNLAVRVVTGAPLVNQTFVIVELVRGFDGATQFLGVLAQGPVTARQGLAWPGSPIVSSLEGDGYPRILGGTQPAAGAEISETVPTGARWRVRQFVGRFTASGAAANRYPRLGFKSGGVIPWESQSPVTVVATNDWYFNWAQHVPYVNNVDTSILNGALPTDTWLAAGDKIITATGGIQAGDQWGQPYYAVDEKLEM